VVVTDAMAPSCTSVHYWQPGRKMSFYVSRWPVPCDPRAGHMGHDSLNGIQTPPARIWFEDRGPGTPVSNWTYDGPLGTLQPLPEIIVPLFTAPCTPRFVIWFVAEVILIDDVPALLSITIAKTFRSFFTVDPWDSYWIQLAINGVNSDAFLEHRQLSDTDYSRYQAQTPGQAWTWTDPANPFQEVSWTEAWPIAWDRTSPGPPFVPGL